MPMPVLGEATTVQAPSTQPLKNEPAAKTPNMNKTAVQSSPNVSKAANNTPANNNSGSQPNAPQPNKNSTPNKTPATPNNNNKPNNQNQNNSANGAKNNFNKGAHQNNGQNQHKNSFNNKPHFDKSKTFNKPAFDKSKYNYNKNDHLNKQNSQGGGYSSNKFNNQNGTGYTTSSHYNDKFDPRDQTSSADKKFTGRCRLFCGNLPQELSEEDFKDLFKKFGETGECFLNTQRSFGFIKLDTRINAEHAKQELDGTQFKGRTIRVRFATHGAAVRVKNLSPFISNEYLEQAFSMFGPVERAVVIVDDKGRPTGEGIVEFERKPASIQCINKCQENCFILTSYPRPIVVEPLEQKDEEDGLPEKSIIKNSQFYMEREAPPHFANNNSNEHKLALRWRELYELEKQIADEGKRRVDQAREMLEYEIEQALIDNKTMQLKEDMRMKQEELQRIEDMRKAEFARRQDMEMRRVDEERQRQEQMALARKLQEQGGVPNQRGNGMFEPSIQQNQQGSGAQTGAMQPNNNQRRNNNNGGNNGGNNFNSNQNQNFNNADLSNLPQDQQQAIIAAQLSFAMAAAAQQGGLNMGGMNDGGQMNYNNNNNNYNNGPNNGQKHHKDDNRGSSGNSRRFDRRGGRGGGHNNNRDDSYPGYDTKRARF